MATENIPSRLHSVAQGNVVTGANEILDDDNNKKQNVINNELIEASGLFNKRIGDKSASTGTSGTYPYNGIGRVYLPKNMINGVNTLTQDMFYKGNVGSRVPNINTIFVIQYDYVLAENITIPENCVLDFDGGSISGVYTLTGINTRLIGKVAINSILSGTFANDIFNVSWVKAASATDLSNVITSILNCGNTVFVDKDITLDGSKKIVTNLNIIGDGHTITNPNKYEVSGNIKIDNVRFVEFTNGGSNIFIYTKDYSEKNIDIYIKNVYFDGNGLCERFYNHYNELDNTTAVVQFENCVIINVTEFGFRHTGRIVRGQVNNNFLKNIGRTTEQLFGSMAIVLGKTYLEVKTAENVMISSNVIDTVKCKYTEVDDGKETHGILLYGNKCSVVNNKVYNIISERADGDPGAESEGIYVKGNYNLISGNVLIDAVGSYSDGAITLKGLEDSSPDRYNNIIENNIIKHKFGHAIVYYGVNGLISNNVIHSSDKAESGIEFLIGRNTIIDGNEITFDNNQNLKVYSGFFVLNADCLDNIIVNNKCSGQAALLVDYNNTPHKIYLNSNIYTIENAQLGYHTKYLSIVQTQNYSSEVYINNCIFNIGSLRSNALIEANALNKFCLSNCRFNFFESADSELTPFVVSLFRYPKVELVGCIFDIPSTYDVRNVFAQDNSDKFANCVFMDKVLTLNTTKVIGDYQFPA